VTEARNRPGQVTVFAVFVWTSLFSLQLISRDGTSTAELNVDNGKSSIGLNRHSYS
jgi:hypothetical protein